MTTAILNVPDISCGHCERTITNTLTPIAGVHNVSVDIAQKRVQIEYDTAQVGVDQMKALLAEEDYPVASVEVAEPVVRGRSLPQLQQVSNSGGCACCSPAHEA